MTFVAFTFNIHNISNVLKNSNYRKCTPSNITKNIFTVITWKILCFFTNRIFSAFFFIPRISERMLDGTLMSFYYIITWFFMHLVYWLRISFRRKRFLLQIEDWSSSHLSTFIMILFTAKLLLIFWIRTKSSIFNY